MRKVTPQRRKTGQQKLRILSANFRLLAARMSIASYFSRKATRESELAAAFPALDLTFESLSHGHAHATCRLLQFVKAVSTHVCTIKAKLTGTLQH